MNKVMSKGIPVVITDHNGKLCSQILASSRGLARINDVEHDTGTAVQLVVGDLADSDFIVRSVWANQRRKMVVLAGQVSVEAARLIPGYVSDDENELDHGNPRQAFHEGDFIVLCNGHQVADFPGTVVLKG